MSRQLFFATLFLSLLLAACTSVEPTPTPTAVTAALRVTAVPPTPDNLRFASAHADSMVRIWDARTGDLLLTYAGHHIPDAYYGGATIYHGVLSVAWSPDGQSIASAGSDDQKVRIWSADSGEELTDLLIDSIRAAHSMAWSPDGTQLALGSGGGVIALLNTTTLSVNRFSDRHTHSVHSLAWLSDGGQLISASIDTVKTGIPDHVLPGHTKPAWSLAWAPDSQFLAVGNMDINIWDVGTEALLDTFVSEKNYYQLDSLSWSPDGSKLAAAEGAYGGKSQIWDMLTSQLIERTEDGWGFADAENGVFEVGWTSNNRLLVSPWYRSDWSPDNSLIAAGQSQQIHIFDMSTGDLRLVLPGHEAITLAIEWSPDGARIASSGSHDQTIRVWDAVTGMEQTEIAGGATYDKLSWSPDGTLLLGVNWNQVSIWDTANWQELRRIELGSNILSIAFSPDGRILAIGSTDGTVRLWGTP